MPTIKWLAIFFKKYFNFQGFYIVYIIIWQFLGWKKFPPSKLGKRGLQKMQNGEYFLGEKHGKIAQNSSLKLSLPQTNPLFMAMTESKCTELGVWRNDF